MRDHACRVLVLCGTKEARELAARLDLTGRFDVQCSLSGATGTGPFAYPALRVGGFGGAEGFSAFLDAQRIDLVVNATHPFANRMTRISHEVCLARGVPQIRLRRPPWTEAPGDCWQRVPTLDDAVQVLPPGACVFLTTGRRTIGQFAVRQDLEILARVLEPCAADHPANVRQVIDRQLSAGSTDEALMRTHAISHLVTKNAGGDGRGKLAAARRLGVEVVMIDRPSEPAGPLAEDVDAAATWLDEHAPSRR